MYILPTDKYFIKDSLRQGDILKNIFHFGVLNRNNISFLYNSTSNPTAWQFNNPPEEGPVIVLSHSCELDKINNGLKVTSIIVAPIRDLNKATKFEKLEELKKTNKLSEDSAQSFLKYFYLEKLEDLSHKDGSVVDFSKPFSYRKNSYEYLLENKIAQLEDEMVAAFSLKLSLYFYRKIAS